MKGTFNYNLILFSLCVIVSGFLVFSPIVAADNHGGETETESSEETSDQEVIEIEGLVIGGC